MIFILKLYLFCKTAWHYGKRLAIRLVLGAVSVFAKLKFQQRQDSVSDTIEDVISKEDPCIAADSFSVVESKRNTEEGNELNSDDPLYCEYDSTWEETSETTSQIYPSFSRVNDYTFNRFQNAAKDMQNYRHNYPNLCEMEVGGMPNLDFYLDSMPSMPDGIYISQFHSQWNKEYHKLERVHTYIQWLFPLQEPGVNHEAVVLSKAEIMAFNSNEIAIRNLQESYKLMLDFYGIKLASEKTGEVTRAHHWEERFSNLNRNTHNNLRITRILKCLGTLGLQHYQAPLVRFFLKETLVHGNLPNVKEGVLNYFLFAVRNKNQRRRLVKFAYHHYKPKNEFVWCPKRIQKIWSCSQASPPPPSKPVGTQTGAGGANESRRPPIRKCLEKQYEAGRKTSPAADWGQGPLSPREPSVSSTYPEHATSSQAVPSSDHSLLTDDGGDQVMRDVSTEGFCSKEMGGKDILYTV